MRVLQKVGMGVLKGITIPHTGYQPALLDAQLRPRRQKKRTIMRILTEKKYTQVLERGLQKKKFTVFQRNKMVRIIEQELKGTKKTLRVSKPDGDAFLKVWVIPEFVDEMEDVLTETPDMKEKESY